MVKNILGSDVVNITAKENGYKYISNGKYVKTLKEAHNERNKWKDNADIYTAYYFYRIHSNYDFLKRKTKDYLKNIIIYSMPHLKGSLYKCSKKDLIFIIKDEKILEVK